MATTHPSNIQSPSSSATAAVSPPPNHQPPATIIFPPEMKYDEQKQATLQYVENKKVRELLRHLMELLVYHRPENVKEFLLEELVKMKNRSYTDLIQDSDLETIFSMTDINSTGSIMGSQMKAAARNLHLPPTAVIANTPDNAKIDVSLFKSSIGRSFDVLDPTQYKRGKKADEGKATGKPNPGPPSHAATTEGVKSVDLKDSHVSPQPTAAAPVHPSPTPAVGSGAAIPTHAAIPPPEPPKAATPAVSPAPTSLNTAISVPTPVHASVTPSVPQSSAPAASIPAVSHPSPAPELAKNVVASAPTHATTPLL